MPADLPFVLNLLFFAIGLVIIIKGSDLFLDHAIWVARASGMPQIVIGATIVSLCTTMPEFVSSCTAAIRGASDMALGNAVGSVIFNTGIILGVMLLFITARVQRHSFALRGVFLLATIATGFFLALPPPRLALRQALAPGNTFTLNRWSGVLLLALMAVYLVINYFETAKHHEGSLHDVETDVGKPTRLDWAKHVALLAAGAALVSFGAFMLVEFGQRLARDLGVSEAVVSLIFVACGTSLPELFTAISAVRKRAEQISIGNILGANVLNIAWVTGAAAIIRPLSFKDTYLVRLDTPVAFVLCAVVFVEGLIVGRVGRKTGIALLMAYSAYMLSILLMDRV